MVAVDPAGRPVAAPPLILESAEDRARFDQGRQRMEDRRRTRPVAGR
jgi:acyl-CoA hydrolase